MAAASDPASVAEAERRQGAEHGLIGIVKPDTSLADFKHAVAEEPVQGGCVAEMEFTLAHEDPGTEAGRDGRDDRAGLPIRLSPLSSSSPLGAASMPLVWMVVRLHRIVRSRPIAALPRSCRPANCRHG